MLLSVLALQGPPVQRIVVRATTTRIRASITTRMATVPDDGTAYPLHASDCLSGDDAVRASRIEGIEECLVELEEARDDPAMYAELLDELTRVKREGMTPGSAEWVAVVVEAEQRSERLAWAARQQASQQGQAFIRAREEAERKAGEGLAYGSSEWAVAVGGAAGTRNPGYPNPIPNPKPSPYPNPNPSANPNPSPHPHPHPHQVDRAASETAAAYRVAEMQKAAQP